MRLLFWRKTPVCYLGATYNQHYSNYGPKHRRSKYIRGKPWSAGDKWSTFNGKQWRFDGQTWKRVKRCGFN